MHTFQEYMALQEHEMGYGYVSVKPTAETIHIIKNLIADAGLSNAIDTSELHMTLAYDTNNPAMKVDVSDAIITGTLAKVKMLGDALVVTVDSEDAQKRFKELLDFGFGTDYPNFIPHISLKYDPSPEDLVDVNSVFKKYKGKTVKLYSETWEFNSGNYIDS